jgi:O-antigen/teichoic acid export membrane protein
MSQSLLVESVKHPSKVKRNYFLTIAFTVILLTSAIILFLFIGKPILLLFGEGYSTAYWFVLVGLISSLPYTANILFFNYCKIMNKLNIIILLNAIYITIILVGSLLTMPNLGIVAIAIFMLGGNIILNVIIFFLNYKKIRNFLKT